MKKLLRQRWRQSEEGRCLDAKPVGGVLVTAEMVKQSKLVLACWGLSLYVHLRRQGQQQSHVNYW